VSVQVQPLAGRVLLPLPAYQRFTAKKGRREVTGTEVIAE